VTVADLDLRRELHTLRKRVEQADRVIDDLLLTLGDGTTAPMARTSACVYRKHLVKRRDGSCFCGIQRGDPA
jgi:hypothetical protein